MSLTLADARTYLHPFITPNGANDSSVIAAINDASERFVNSGLWRGSKLEVQFASPSGYITLPHHLESILGVRFDCRPVQIYNQWYTYLTGGPGGFSDESYTTSGLIDMGIGFPCFLDISADATLKVEITDANDATKTVWLKGLDADSDPIYNTTGVEGISVTTVNPTVTTSQVFSRLSGVQKPVTEGRVLLYQVIDGEDTLIGQYEPGETVADYHRYQLGTTGTPTTVTALCKRKFVPVRSESDLVYPGNRGAMKLACMALNYETQNDLGRAEEFWALAFKQLDLESRQTRGGNQTRINTSAHGFSLGRVRTMR